MAVPLLTIIMASASLGGGFDSAQTAYTRCLAKEVNAAVTRGIDRESFSRGVPLVCQSETAVYRRMAVAAIIGQGLDGASPAAAAARFEQSDRANRADMISTFETRMRLRRGPSRVAGLPENQPEGQD